MISTEKISCRTTQKEKKKEPKCFTAKTKHKIQKVRGKEL